MVGLAFFLRLNRLLRNRLHGNRFTTCVARESASITCIARRYSYWTVYKCACGFIENNSQWLCNGYLATRIVKCAMHQRIPFLGTAKVPIYSALGKPINCEFHISEDSSYSLIGLKVIRELGVSVTSSFQAQLLRLKNKQTADSL